MDRDAWDRIKVGFMGCGQICTVKSIRSNGLTWRLFFVLNIYAAKYRNGRMSSQKRPLKDQYKTGESKLEPLWASLTYNAPTVIQQQSYLFNIGTVTLGLNIGAEQELTELQKNTPNNSLETSTWWSIWGPKQSNSKWKLPLGKLYRKGTYLLENWGFTIIKIKKRFNIYFSVFEYFGSRGLNHVS